MVDFFINSVACDKRYIYFSTFEWLRIVYLMLFRAIDSKVLLLQNFKAFHFVLRSCQVPKYVPQLSSSNIVFCSSSLEAMLPKIYKFLD